MAQKRCEGCRVVYPRAYLQPFEVADYTVDDVCGCCALVLSNVFSELNREKFDGPRAEANRQRALEHRRRTGQVPRDLKAVLEAARNEQQRTH